jgi:hypothetical protein
MEKQRSSSDTIITKMDMIIKGKFIILVHSLIQNKPQLSFPLKVETSP